MPDTVAILWAKRLGMHDPATVAEFEERFQRLPEAIRDTPVPTKEGARCALCKKRVQLDSRYKEYCNGFCAAGGCRSKNRGSDKGAEVILGLWRALGAPTDERVRAVSDADASGIVGLSASSYAPREEEAEEEPKVLGSGQQCPHARTESGFCSRRCEGKEAARVATLARIKMEEAAGEAAKAPAPAPAPKLSKRPAASLNGLLSGLKKPPPKPKPAPAACEPPPPVSYKVDAPAPAPAPKRQPRPAPAPAPRRQPQPPPVSRPAPVVTPPLAASPAPPAPPTLEEFAEGREAADLQRFVTEKIGTKYWPLIEEEEIGDLATRGSARNDSPRRPPRRYFRRSLRAANLQVFDAPSPGRLRLMTAEDLQDMKLPLGPRLKLLKAISLLPG